MANRKRNKQLEIGGLIITKAVYGARKALTKLGETGESSDELASQVLDVTLPLNFLVNDSGRLKVWSLESCCLYNSENMNLVWCLRHCSKVWQKPFVICF